jgi:hypothetical protein
MSGTLDSILADLRERGYDQLSRPEGFPEEATGQVPLPEAHRREPAGGWRTYLPGVYCDAGDPDLVPEDLREVVEGYGWTVQAMGRDDETVTVVVSKNGV